MRGRVILWVAAPALALAYWYAVVAGIGLAASLLVPSLFWLGLVPKHGPAPQWHLFATELLLATVAIVLISVPFAWVIGRFYTRVGLLLGAAMAVVVAIGTYAPFWIEISEIGDSHFRVRWLIEAIEVCAFLPILIWLMQRLPSNYRLERP